MRLLPGQPADIVGESLSSYSLTRAAIANVDILPRVYQAYNEEDFAPISSILAEKGYFTKGLREGTWNSKFRTVGSNHVMYAIQSSHKRKCKFALNETGVAFSSSAYPTLPGKRQTPFYIYLDNNWLRPKEALELNDNRTLLYAYKQEEPKEYGGLYRYEVKLITNSLDAYVDTALLADGAEATPVMAPYEHDFSETGSEKYAFDGWGHSYMTLQRVKMSYSGTAAAMNTTKNWYQYANSSGGTARGYISYAEDEMLKRAVQYNEYSIVFGQSTVTIDGQVLMRDGNNREIMMGSGLIYGGDGAIERPFTTEGWTMKFTESLIEDLDIRVGKDGKKEAIIAGGKASIMSFYKMMQTNGFMTMNNNVEGSGSDKGVNMDYAYFEWMGYRLIPRVYGWMSSKDRPQKYLTNGKPKGSWDTIVMPLGPSISGDPSVELVQLRPPRMGSLAGIDEGGDDMSSSVDGTSKHYLWQNGIITRSQIYRCFMPYAA